MMVLNLVKSYASWEETGPGLVLLRDLELREKEGGGSRASDGGGRWTPRRRLVGGCPKAGCGNALCMANSGATLLGEGELLNSGS